MRCPICDGDNVAGAAICGFCGTPLVPPQGANPFSEQQPYAPPRAPMAEPRKMEDDLATRMLIPVGRSIHAIAAGYLGLLSLGCCALGPFAILFGVLALLDIRKNPNKGGIVRAIFGIVLGAIASLGLIFLLIGLVAGEFQ